MFKVGLYGLIGDHNTIMRINCDYDSALYNKVRINSAKRGLSNLTSLMFLFQMSSSLIVELSVELSFSINRKTS